MAVNHVDGVLFVSIVMYPIVAGKAALSQGVGWLMLPLIPVSICIGVVVIHFGRKLVYAILEFCFKRLELMKAWAQQILGMPLFVLYFVLPFAIIGAGLYSTWIGSVWLAQIIAQI